MWRLQQLRLRLRRLRLGRIPCCATSIISLTALAWSSRVRYSARDAHAVEAGAAGHVITELNERVRRRRQSSDRGVGDGVHGLPVDPPDGAARLPVQLQLSLRLLPVRAGYL